MEKISLIQEKELTWIVINREKVRNAIDDDVMDQLLEALGKAKQDESKAVIITGAGEVAFCSGGDLSVFRNLKTESEAWSMLSKMRNVLEELFYFPKLTIAALNGVAVGGGCEIATACDLRLAAPHVKVGFIQGTLGITTGWGGASMLYERLAQPIAMDMLMSSTVYRADEARALGFLQGIVLKEPFRQGVKEWLTPYVKLENAVLEAYKLRYIDKVPREQLSQRMKDEVAECAKLWESDEHHRAVERFISRT
ncbi:enoyl-CoA hydratase/isomerase family protein [Bacillus sp. FJAT-45037]|uniref:enoyl-CoA hydratase/isomerase family protein n=1 Tax=Bacillus sp. FJAT-45037 TaxID=2011007 RepID=UPI000C2322CF|nr:enoyl-CoA hydratase/isomerase family protein [Bacillus sp. FJAT-45037]